MEKLDFKKEGFNIVNIIFKVTENKEKVYLKQARDKNGRFTKDKLLYFEINIKNE